MARWALRSKHYLNMVEEWRYEYTETARATGRSKKYSRQVPRYLDPNEPSDWTYDEEVTVCYEGKGRSKDHVFFGEPTADMECLDEEAEAISASLRHKWFNAMGDAAFPAQGPGGFSDNLLAKFEASLSEVINRIGIPKAENLSLKGAEGSLIAQMQAQMEAMAIKQAELEAKLAGQSLAPEPGEAVEDLSLEELDKIEASPVPPPEALTNVARRI
jgi:hypothetical protein